MHNAVYKARKKKKKCFCFALVVLAPPPDYPNGRGISRNSKVYVCVYVYACVCVCSIRKSSLQSSLEHPFAISSFTLYCTSYHRLFFVPFIVRDIQLNSRHLSPINEMYFVVYNYRWTVYRPDVS